VAVLTPRWLTVIVFCLACTDGGVVVGLVVVGLVVVCRYVSADATA